ncbi:MAG: hypothetical protein DRQ99_18445 [Candidatus Parabeggiatoa sp. nov. 3]|nr:MAG: hypothetical protein DRQ99_18445 [Gammaproteobacteria bacterium]
MANQASEQVDTLESFFEETLQKMDRQFTSHDFFLKLLHGHQNEYVAALAAHQDKGTPFKDLHWALFQRLQKLEGKLIKKQQDDYPSQDIFGIASTTTLWRKV